MGTLEFVYYSYDINLKKKKEKIPHGIKEFLKPPWKHWSLYNYFYVINDLKPIRNRLIVLLTYQYKV